MLYKDIGATPLPEEHVNMAKSHTAYADKHGPDATADSRIVAALSARAKDNTLSCAAAFDIAATLAVTMEAVGLAMDLGNVRLVKCQLGLFGYGGKNPLKAAPSPSASLRKALAPFKTSGRVPCREVFGIALRSGVPPQAVSNACEGMGLKIKPCQLGAF